MYETGFARPIAIDPATLQQSSATRSSSRRGSTTTTRSYTGTGFGLLTGLSVSTPVSPSSVWKPPPKSFQAWHQADGSELRRTGNAEYRSFYHLGYVGTVLHRAPNTGRSTLRGWLRARCRRPDHGAGGRPLVDPGRASTCAASAWHLWSVLGDFTWKGKTVGEG